MTLWVLFLYFLVAMPIGKQFYEEVWFYPVAAVGGLLVIVIVIAAMISCCCCCCKCVRKDGKYYSKTLINHTL